MKTSIWPKPVEEMSDLELLDHYCETCSVFTDPRIFRHVAARGLVWAVNDLGRGSRENKALVRAKLLARPTVGGASAGRYTGDPEIEQVASMIDRIQALKNHISRTKASDAREIRDLAEALQNVAQQLVDYYK